MLPFNEEFQTGESKITQVRLSVLLNNGTLLSLTEEHVMLGGLTRDSSTTVDGAFTVGAAVTGKLTVVLDNSDQSLSEYDFRAADITASLGGQLSDGNYELIQIGIYTVDEYTYDGSNITLTAYDNFHKFDLPCSESSVTFPRTITQLITQACSLAGVTLANASIPNGSYSVTEQPESWDTMTWHDVVSYCAQIGCCFARILPNGKLFLSWYNVASLPGDQYDGGTFDTETTPYSDGAALDGGDFTYSETVDISGGEFGDRDDVTIIGSSFDLSVDTDDVLITGVTVTLAATNNIEATEGTADYEKTLGSTGYIIRIENNPLIETTDNADAVCSYIYNFVVGMRFRPLNASIPENPALEAGDVALVVDRYNNTYTSFLSHVTYTTNSSTQISCDAESTMQNLKARYSEAQKTRAMAQRAFEKAITDAESAMQTIMSAVATTLGLNRFTESDGHGGTIYTYGNGTTLAASNIRWRFSAGALMVSSDYGRTWNGALTANGTAVLQEIYAVKVNADNILTGTLTVGGSNNTNGTIKVYDANGVLCGEIDNSGASVTGIMMSYNNTNGFATKIRQGRLYFFGGSNYTYEQLKVLGWSDASGVMSSAKARSSADGSYDLHGFSITTAKSFIEIGKRTSDTAYAPYYFLNLTNGGTLEGYSERHKFTGTVRFGGEVFHNASINIKNPSTGTQSVRWLTASTDSKYAYIGYDESTNRIFVQGKDISSVGFYAAGSISCGGAKNRAVDTKHYGTVGMNAFETASSHFADIGSGTVSEDGTVAIFFDPVFAETIDLKAQYQVFLTMTSEAKTEWVDKQNGYFIVHGDPGATFDWMITGYQREYVTNRMEQIYKPDPDINDSPIITENTDAIDKVEQMVAKYNEELEGLNDD